MNTGILVLLLLAVLWWRSRDTGPVVPPVVTPPGGDGELPLPPEPPIVDPVTPQIKVLGYRLKPGSDSIVIIMVEVDGLAYSFTLDSNDPVRLKAIYDRNSAIPPGKRTSQEWAALEALKLLL